MTNTVWPTYFLSHGGGPWPWMKAEMPTVWDKLEHSLQQMPRDLKGQPKAIVMVSAHWECSDFTVMTAANPGMLYDYSGFPEQTYRVTYPAPGAPELAEQVLELLRAAGLPVARDATRGYDHGAFVPLAVAYPGADVPVVQLSIQRGYDPARHFAVGRALASLRSQGVLILGSGLSFHNLRRFNTSGGGVSMDFDRWLRQSVTSTTGAAREALLADWESAPAARESHPREDHLVPLFVAAGAAYEDVGITAYHEEKLMGALAISSFRFGQLPA